MMSRTMGDLITAGQTETALTDDMSIALWNTAKAGGYRNEMLTAPLTYFTALAEAARQTPTSHLVGCITSADTDTDHDVIVTPGKRRDSTDTVNIPAASGNMTKQIDAAWAAGDDAGGLFSGSVAADTSYHFFIIKKDSDDSVDYGWDTSVIAANRPSGWTKYRRLRSYRTDASANIIGTRDLGSGRFEFTDRYAIFSNATSAATSQTSIYTGVPEDLVAVADFLAAVHYNDNADRGVAFGRTDQTVSVGFTGFPYLETATASRKASTAFSLSVDSDGEIAYIASEATPDNFTVLTLGYYDIALTQGA